MSTKQYAWSLDQMGKSLFFHRKLHEWGLIKVAELIEGVPGETLDWDLDQLSISKDAWNRVIHSGVKPIIVFANPAILTTIEKSVSYYRMLAMVSQKSMNQIGASSARYEQSDNLPKPNTAFLIAQRLNLIISNLVESDNKLNRREFDVWRGMAAGSQAQGSWQNRKGDQAEYEIRQKLVEQLRRSGLIEEDRLVNIHSRILELNLLDGRRLSMGSEPDLVIFSGDRIQAAVEIKGGIDAAGVLERIGAAMKSLSRVKEDDPTAITILIVSRVSMSPQAESDILANKQTVNSWFAIEDILQNPSRRSEYYRLLGLS